MSKTLLADSDSDHGEHPKYFDCWIDSHQKYFDSNFALLLTADNMNDLTADNMNGLVMIHGRKMSSSAMSNGFSNAGSGWFEYGAIDDGIIEKLRDEEDVRVRLTGAYIE